MGKTWVGKTASKPLVTKGLPSFFHDFGTRHIRGVVVREQKTFPLPPFFKNFPAFPIGKIANNSKIQKYKNTKIQKKTLRAILPSNSHEPQNYRVKVLNTVKISSSHRLKKSNTTDTLPVALQAPFSLL